jgi:O-antigen/teichoic acid export membrane protein
VLLVATYAILAVGAVPYFIALALNRPGVTAVANAVMAAVNVPLVLVLVPPFGSTGAAAAYVVSVLPTFGFVVFVERRILHVTSSPWRAVAIRLSVAALPVVALLLMLRDHLHDIAAVVSALVVSMVAIPALYFAFGASHDDRAIVRSLVRRQRTRVRA